MHMETEKPHKKGFHLALPLLFCLNISTNKMQLILYVHIWGSSAAGLLNLETRATWPINCTTLFTDYSLDLTSEEEKKEKKNNFWSTKGFYFLAKAVFQTKMTSLFPVGTLYIRSPLPFPNARRNTGSCCIPLPLNLIHQHLCNRIPHRWFPHAASLQYLILTLFAR